MIEAEHTVHAIVVDRSGRHVLRLGDPARVTFLRSSAKPFQALPLVRAFPDLAAELVAIACASHLARKDQVAAVRRLLELAAATEDDLECGPEPTRIAHNCSGKHAGMLAVCASRGWERQGYRLPSHPLQRQIVEEIGFVSGRAHGAIVTGVDGCGVPTFALTLEEAAGMFGRLADLDGGPRVIAAMQAHPELLRGPVGADAMLARDLPGWAAKGGAEGLLCARSPDGLGLALKVEDGATRAVRPALAVVLRQLGHDPGSLGDVAVESSRGDVVGALEA